MLAKYSQLLAEVQKTIPTATMEQIEEILAGGDENSVLSKSSKLQSVLTEVSKMQPGGLVQATEAPIAPAAQKKGGRLTKAQKIDLAKLQAEEQAQAATSALDITTAQTIKSAQRQDAALTNLEDDVSAYLTGRYLGVNAAIARNVLGGIKDAGDSCDVGLADITEKAVGSALELFFASVGE